MHANATDLQGCFNLSNAIEVIRLSPEDPGCIITSMNDHVKDVDVTLAQNPSSGLIGLTAAFLNAHAAINIETFSCNALAFQSLKLNNIMPQYQIIDHSNLASGI